MKKKQNGTGKSSFSLTVRDGYFALLDHSVYIPKFHKRIQSLSKNPSYV